MITFVHLIIITFVIKFVHVILQHVITFVHVILQHVNKVCVNTDLEMCSE